MNACLTPPAYSKTQRQATTIGACKRQHRRCGEAGAVEGIERVERIERIESRESIDSFDSFEKLGSTLHHWGKRPACRTFRLLYRELALGQRAGWFGTGGNGGIGRHSLGRWFCLPQAARRKRAEPRAVNIPIQCHGKGPGDSRRFVH